MAILIYKCRDICVLMDLLWSEGVAIPTEFKWLDSVFQLPVLLGGVILPAKLISTYCAWMYQPRAIDGNVLVLHPLCLLRHPLQRRS